MGSESEGRRVYGMKPGGRKALEAIQQEMRDHLPPTCPSIALAATHPPPLTDVLTAAAFLALAALTMHSAELIEEVVVYPFLMTFFKELGLDDEAAGYYGFCQDVVEKAAVESHRATEKLLAMKLDPSMQPDVSPEAFIQRMRDQLHRSVEKDKESPK